MDLDFINRTIKYAFLLGIVAVLPLWFYESAGTSLGFLAGAGWGCLNLLFIKQLVQNSLDEKERSFSKILLVLSLKFPILYAAGYFILSYDSFPILAVVAGSSLIFPVMVLLSAKNMLTTTAAAAALLVLPAGLYASLDSDVPEVPNIFTLLNKAFHSPWTEFLHQWESIIFSLITAVAISLLFYAAAKKKEMIPSGLQNFVETIVEILRNFVVEILGPEGVKYVPLIGTLFVYILVMNWLALIPFMKPPTSSFNVTVALAACVFVYVQYLNVKNWGFFGFIYHLAGSPKDTMGWIMVPLMFPIEVLTQLTRPITLALRLFGNVVGEDILIGAAALFGVYLIAESAAFVGLPTQIPFLLLALMTGLMQALVFTLLTTIYILLSMPSSDEMH